MVAIHFDNVSKKYKLYSKGGLYLRDRITHVLGRLKPFNGTQSPALAAQQSLERDFWALKNVSFEIKPGESVGFIGRNGAGKSTILKLLAGVTKPSSGKVEVNGRVAALIEVGAGFHPELTGRENIYLNGSILGMKKIEIEEQFDSIVSFAELEDFIDTPVKHYSSGMYVRLGFAVAVHTKPDTYLVDEVLAVGDEAFQIKCLDILAAHKTAGKTMILVSHQLNRIEEICDRAVYIEHGQIIYDGLPSEVIDKYRRDINVKPTVNNIQQNIYGMQAEIVDVVFYNSSGQRSSEFATGEGLKIEARFRTHCRIQNPVVGIVFHGPKGENIGWVNSSRADLKFDESINEQTVTCHVPNLPLQNDIYWISVALHSDGHNILYYDRHDRRYRISVRSKARSSGGLVKFDCCWALKYDS